MSDRLNAALEAAADRLRTRACGYLARHDTIYNGRIVSEELLELAKAILALREAEDQRGAAEQGAAVADRWRQAAPHEALEVLLARHRENFSPAEVREVEQAIFALREANGKVDGDGKPAPASPGPMVLVCRQRLEALLEYWNGHPNERAMWDALTHTQEELHAMLAAAEEERNET